MMVDVSGGRIGRAPRPKPAKREIDIWDLLDWAWRRQRAPAAVESAEREDGRLLAGGGSNLNRVRLIGLLGTQIDCLYSGSARAVGQCDPDAAAVYLVARSILDSRRMVRLHMAIERGAMPDWGEALKPVVVIFKQNQSVHRKVRSVEIKNGRTGARYCPIAYRDQTAEIIYAREQWRDVWGALADLARELGSDVLERFAVTGPRFPSEPWGTDADSRKCLTPTRSLDKDSGA